MAVFDDEKLKRKRYSFIGNNREILRSAKVGNEVEIVAKNERGCNELILFRVTRNAHLGKRQKWVYGRVLNFPADEYYQIEIKMYDGEPSLDSIEIYIQAPPTLITELR